MRDGKRRRRAENWPEGELERETEYFQNPRKVSLVLSGFRWVRSRRWGRLPPRETLEKQLSGKQTATRNL
ncbi:hypothetical protein RRG08_024299 [Elysia crispata]|uniref:Uncharacterized protein n=1 Tax=Elysia crispata TaxID=231223 RepID=A0AAE1DRQ9_9GAST|nr:hypothetical protein RRG08_024299 [Elysia crispata]